MTTTSTAEHPVTIHRLDAGHVVWCHQHGRITIPTSLVCAQMAADLHDLIEHSRWA